jgi:nucleotide-binding universal stress UspA family protein
MEAPVDDAPILICYDDSEGSRHAIDAAARLFADRRAVVLDIAPLLTVAESYASLGAVTPEFEDLNRRDAESRAQVGAELARAAGFTAEARAELDAPTWQGIVGVADDIDAAVIVIGSRGLTGFREAFEGSVSHEVAGHAGRPVLIVPPARRSEERREAGA